MDRLEVSLNADQAKALSIAKAFVWSEAAQLIESNLRLSPQDLRRLCLDKFYEIMDQATAGQFTKELQANLDKFKS